MKNITFLIASLVLFVSSASAQYVLPIGDTNLFCLTSPTGSRLAQFGATGYTLVSQPSVIKGMNKKINTKKEKKARLAAVLSNTEGSAARLKIKNKIKALKTEIAALKLDKTRIGDCLNGTIVLALGFTPIKIASKKFSSNTWDAWAYIDPRPIRVNLKGGGYAQFGSYGSLWCATYQGTFADQTRPPWPAGTEFSLVKDFDLCDPLLNAPAGACQDMYGTRNAGILVLHERGGSEEEARALVSTRLGGISYSARIQRASTCAGDLSTL